MTARKEEVGLTEPPAEPTADNGSWGDWLVAFYDRCRWIMLGMVVVYYAAAFNGQWRPEPDAALYLTLARNVALGRGYTYHGQPHALAYPGLPYTLAGLYNILGIDNIFAAHALILLGAAIALGLTYRFVRLRADRGTAVLVTCMTGMTYHAFQYAYQIRNDLPFLAGVMMVLAGYEAWRMHKARWWDAVMVLAGVGICVVMRPAMWALLGALVATAMMHLWWIRGKKRAVIWAIALAVGISLLALAARGALAGLWTASGAVAPSLTTYEESVFVIHGTTWPMHLLHSLNILLTPIATEATMGHEFGPGLTQLTSLLVLVVGFALARKRLLWGIFFALNIGMMLVHVPIPRYFLPMLPLLALGWLDLARGVNRAWPGMAGNLGFAALMLLWVAPNFLKISAMVFEQRKLPIVKTVDDGRWASFPELGNLIENKVPEHGWVLSPTRKGRVLTFYSDRNVIDGAMAPRLRGWKLPLYVIEPIDAATWKIITDQNLKVGAVVGPPAGSKPLTTGGKNPDNLILRRLIEMPLGSTTRPTTNPATRPTVPGAK